MAHRILIIEDEDALRESLKRVLLKEGYDVQAVDSAEEALPLLQKNGATLLSRTSSCPARAGWNV